MKKFLSFLSEVAFRAVAESMAARQSDSVVATASSDQCPHELNLDHLPIVILNFFFQAVDINSNNSWVSLEKLQ